jgi:hypothetical protein
MKRVFTFLVFVLCFADCIALAIKPSRTIELSVFAPKATECDGSRVLYPNSSVWINDQNLVVWLISTCGSHDPHKRKSFSVLVFINSDGKAQVLQRPETLLRISRGPAGTLLVGHGAIVDLIEPNLHVEQSIECPDKNLCAVFPSPSGSDESDFALCSIVSSTEHCDLFKGLPAARLPERGMNFPAQERGIPKDPYQVALTKAVSAWPDSPYARAWRVSENELWYFDRHGVLTNSIAGRSLAPVSSEQWTPKDSACTGEVSAFKPMRFLATCVGTHFYTDGDLDAIFGYSRIALFDVTSKQKLTSINGPVDATAALSPGGGRIAVIHRGRVKIWLNLYEVD